MRWFFSLNIFINKRAITKIIAEYDEKNSKTSDKYLRIGLSKYLYNPKNNITRDGSNEVFVISINTGEIMTRNINIMSIAVLLNSLKDSVMNTDPTAPRKQLIKTKRSDGLVLKYRENIVRIIAGRADVLLPNEPVINEVFVPSRKVPY